MGSMLATIWIRLSTADSTINDRLSVHFYSVAFLSFVESPSLFSLLSRMPRKILTSLEERAVYYRETKNGFYTTLPFVLANTLVGMPFLGVCTLLFTLISASTPAGGVLPLPRSDARCRSAHAHVRRATGDWRVRERILDECGRILRQSTLPPAPLVLFIPLHRLPTLCV
ncbi:hypothetical protein B0H14DRAFT_3059988 [Mycena olivaceomarginata]|nr:hypothetical protein B0H14DRAFT_3059988 [Mycena olivaceomarginata]